MSSDAVGTKTGQLLSIDGYFNRRSLFVIPSILTNEAKINGRFCAANFSFWSLFLSHSMQSQEDKCWEFSHRGVRVDGDIFYNPPSVY